MILQARAGLLPTLAAQAAYVRIDGARMLNGGVATPAGTALAALVANVPVASLQAWADWRRAKGLRDATAARALDVRRRVMLATARAYIAVYAQRRVLEISQRANETARSHLDFSEKRFQGGVGNRLDMVRAAQEVQTTAAEIERNQTALFRIREALGILIGSDQQVDVAEAPSFQVPEIDLTKLKELAQARSDVKADAARLSASEESVRLHWTDFMPTLNLAGQAALQDPTTVLQPSPSWQVQLVLRLPLYDGGLRYGLQHQRRANQAQGQIALEATQRQAESEIRAALEAMQRARAALESSRAAAALAVEALKLAELAYRQGSSTNIEIVDAQRRARDLETTSVIAEDGLKQAQLDLLVAIDQFSMVN